MKKQVAASPSIAGGREGHRLGDRPRTGSLTAAVTHGSPNNENRTCHLYSSPYGQRLTPSHHRTLTHGSGGRRSASSAEKRNTSDKKKKEKSPNLGSPLNIPTTPTADSSIDGNDLAERICSSGSDRFVVNTKINDEINQHVHGTGSKNKENTPKTAIRKMKEHQRAQDGMILMLKGEINRKKQLLTSTQDKTNAVNSELKLCENKIIDLNHQIESLKDQLKKSNGEISLLKFQIKKTCPESPESTEVLRKQLEVSIELNKRLESQMKSWLDEQIRLHQLLAEKAVEFKGQSSVDKVESKPAAPATDSTTETPNVLVTATAAKSSTTNNIESSPRVFRDLFSGLCSTFDEVPTKVEETVVPKQSCAVPEIIPAESTSSSKSNIDSLGTPSMGGAPRNNSSVSNIFMYDSVPRRPNLLVEDKENVYSKFDNSTHTTTTNYNFSRSSATKSVMTPNSSFIEQLNRVKEENNSIKNDIMKFRGRLKTLQLDI